MNSSLQRNRRPRALVALLASLVIAGLATAAAAQSGDSSGGIERDLLGTATPANAPGQELYLQRVTIAPKAKLAEHFHQGTQVARVASGVLTYDIVSGTATVIRSNGDTQEISGPKKIRLRRGDTIVETADLVHFGSNRTDRPVVIELAALLEQRAPLATPVGEEASGTAIEIAVDLESQERTLHEAGADGALVYGWNRLTGTAEVDDEPVGVELLGSVRYTSGDGPFSGFVTFSFEDGSTLAVEMRGVTTADPDTADARFAATLAVIAGTGRYEDTTGSGTFVGTRTAALGTAVVATFEIRLSATD